MKKLLGLLAATGLVATTSATVVACGDVDPTPQEKLVTDVANFIKAGNDKWVVGTTTAQDIIDDVYENFVVKDGNVVADSETLEGLTADSLILSVVESAPATKLEENQLSFDIAVFTTKAGEAEGEFVKNEESAQKSTAVVSLKDGSGVTTPVITTPGNQEMTMGGKPLVLTIDVTNTVADEYVTAVSGDPNTASVVASEDKNEITITAVAVGTTDITLNYEGAEAVTFTVTVSAEGVQTPVITAPTNQTMKVGDNPLVLTIDVTNTVADEYVTAVSGDPNTASVVASEDKNEITITAVAVGTTDITLSYEGAEAVTFTVTVSEAE